jgi:hypothetical protein
LPYKFRYILIPLVEVDKFSWHVFACGTECYCETWTAVGEGNQESVPSGFFFKQFKIEERRDYTKWLYRFFFFLQLFFILNAVRWSIKEF